MAIDVATSAASSFTGGTGPHNVTLPSGISSGDRLIIVGGTNNDDCTISATGWTSVGNFTSGGSNRSLSVIERVADGGEGGTVSVSKTVSGAWIGFLAFRITGAHGSTASESSGAHMGSGSDPNPPSLNPSGWDSEETLWLAILMANLATNQPAGWPSGIPTNYTAVLRDWNGNTLTMAAAKRILTASSDDPGTFDTTASGGTTMTIAVRPAAGAGSKVPLFMAHYNG